jgi:signal transduction histidine kinase
VEVDEDFVQRVCDLLLEISQGRFSLDDVAIEAEDDVGRRAVFTGLLMLNDELTFQNEQRIAAQNETLKRETRLRALFDVAKVAIWDCGVRDVQAQLAQLTGKKNGAPLEERVEAVRALTERLSIRSVNQEALNMLHADSAAAIERHIRSLSLADGARLFGTLFRGLSEGKTRIEVEGQLTTITGEPLMVLAALSVPQHTGLDEDVAIITMSDITSHHARVLAEQESARRGEELARVNSEVERLFYAVAHDLRSPLRAVDTLASWIMDDFEAGDIDEVRNHIRTLRSRITRLDQMLNDLLSYARIGRTQHAVEEVDVADLLSEVTTTLLQVPAGFSVRWAGMPRLTTHRTLLSQVFQNLINNAIKHHDRDRGEIVVSWEEHGSRHVFRVSDDGPGIPEAHRQRIFGLFSTLKRRDEVEGSGMGLAFVQKVVRKMGGQVAVEGPEARGATFKFDWPRVTKSSDDSPADDRAIDRTKPS